MWAISGDDECECAEANRVVNTNAEHERGKKLQRKKRNRKTK